MNVRAGDPREEKAFVQGLHDVGYIKGQNLVIEYRDAERKPERLPALAAELAALKVDVIVSAAGTLGALAAKQATTVIPIVFTAVGDPVADGLVTSLARPGGNITGLTGAHPELAGKLLELLKQAVPTVSRVALLLKPDFGPQSTVQTYRREAHTAARVLGIELKVVEARNPEEFERAFSEISEARADALAVLATPAFTAPLLMPLVTKSRLPSAFTIPLYMDYGGLLSYGPSNIDSARRAATYVDKILKGAKPADLPVQQPTKFELVINLRTAQALGLTVPHSLLQRADEVIE